MNDEVNYQNNPLHGVSLKSLLTQLVGHYGFDILFAYLNINCFRANPSLESSLKFLKKTDWAREKVEAFYLYQFKNLPKASFSQFEIPPRDRIIPEGQSPGEPAVLSLEDAERLREKRAQKAAEKRQGSGHRSAKSGSGNIYGGAQRDDRKNRHRGGDAPSRPERDSAAPSTPPANSGVDPWEKSRK
ncbi:VF530 family DNA-binding protein [Aestuariirhabdus sp. LZHN29]|uniref:VF530 family protein n=1 Tax=Aestuariirhabdus sp. LZHN29 TaxID=3417462 RepID=UPI003CF46517